MKLLLLLLACWTTPEPAPPPPTEPPVVPEPAVTPEDDTVLAEVVVHPPGRAPVGARVLADRRVQQLQGGPPPTWHTTRRLTEVQRAELDLLLEPGSVEALAELFPRVPRAPEQVPSATWRLRLGEGLKTVRIPTYGLLRASPFDEIEALLRQGVSVAQRHTQWTVSTGGNPVRFELTCDPRDVPAVRGLFAHLSDPALKPAPLVPPAAERLRIDTARGLATERIVWLVDGRVLRTDASGQTSAFRLPEDTDRRAARALDALHDPVNPPRCP